MEPLVSVIVPVYNVEEFLDQCLESIVGQTYQKLEIILIDDGSSDSCPQKCDIWAEKDSRVKVFHKKNAGVGYARNDGLNMSKGSYITFVDSDDYLERDAIEIMVERMKQDQSDLVVAQCAKIYPKCTQSVVPYPWLLNGVITQSRAIQMMGAAQALPVYMWGKLYCRDIFDEIRFASLTCAEDVYALPKILERCQRISLVEKVLYFYRQRSNSIVHNRGTVQIMDSIVASLYVSRYLLEHGYVEGASRYYYAAVCQSYSLKERKEAKQRIKVAFNVEEIKMLRNARDKNMMASILAAQFPLVYRFYKSCKKKCVPEKEQYGNNV